MGARADRFVHPAIHQANFLRDFPRPGKSSRAADGRPRGAASFSARTLGPNRSILSSADRETTVPRVERFDFTQRNRRTENNCDKIITNLSLQCCVAALGGVADNVTSNVLTLSLTVSDSQRGFVILFNKQERCSVPASSNEALFVSPAVCPVNPEGSWNSRVTGTLLKINNSN